MGKLYICIFKVLWYNIFKRVWLSFHRITLGELLKLFICNTWWNFSMSWEMCLQSWSYTITNETVTFRFTSTWADWVVGAAKKVPIEYTATACQLDRKSWVLWKYDFPEQCSDLLSVCKWYTELEVSWKVASFIRKQFSNSTKLFMFSFLFKKRSHYVLNVSLKFSSNCDFKYWYL